MKNVKIGIVGAGVIAREHIKALNCVTNVELVGIVSRTHKTAEALAKEYQTEAFTSVSDMVLKQNPDGLIIAVDVKSTRQVLQKCLSYSCNILVEKPVALNYRAAVELQNFDDEDNLGHVYVAHNRRFYNSTKMLGEKLYYSEKPRTVFITDQQDPIEAISMFGEDPEVANNYMYANSIHLVDYFKLLCRGNVVDVQVLAPFQGNKEHVIHAKVTFDSNDIGYYKCAWCSSGLWSIEVYCGEHYFECKPLERLIQRSRNSRMDNILSQEEGQLKPGFIRQATEFVAACRGEETELVSLSASIDVMHLISKIFNLED